MEFQIHQYDNGVYDVSLTKESKRQIGWVAINIVSYAGAGFFLYRTLKKG